MSLSHALLGFLSYAPMTGYDLKTQHFDGSVAHFWPADQAQIYLTLNKLSEAGLVESHIEIQSERPNRKVYTITDAGRTALRDWLTTIQPLRPYREPFLVQVFFAAQLANATIIAMLEQQRRMHEEMLAHYQTINIPTLTDPQARRESTLQQLTLNFGIAIEQQTIAWLSESIQIMRDLPEA